MSHSPAIEELLIDSSKSVKEALKIIDGNAQGTCFVVDGNKKLIGVVTDGDIRRALIDGKKLESNVKEVMQTKFTSLPVTTPIDQIQSKISERIRHIPLVDENNIPVDYASFTKVHRIPVMTPLLSGNELKYVTECITTGWISSQGAYVKKFEQ